MQKARRVKPADNPFVKAFPAIRLAVRQEIEKKGRKSLLPGNTRKVTVTRDNLAAYVSQELPRDRAVEYLWENIDLGTLRPASRDHIFEFTYKINLEKLIGSIDLSDPSRPLITKEFSYHPRRAQNYNTP